MRKSARTKKAYEEAQMRDFDIIIFDNIAESIQECVWVGVVCEFGICGFLAWGYGFVIIICVGILARSCGQILVVIREREMALL